MVLRLVIWTFLLTCGLGCHSRVPLSPLEQAEKVLQSGDFKSAKTLAKAIPREHPQWAEAQLMIGGIETTYRYAGAGLPYYESVPRDGSPVSMKAIRAIAEIHLKLGALEKSAMHYRELLEQHPEDRFARRKLATILADTGQRFEAETELLELGKRVPMEIKEVVLLTEPDRPASPSAFLRQCAQANARDPFVNFGLAVEEVAAQNFDDARKRLGLVIETNPEFTAAHALSGELALDVGLAELQAWNKKLPVSAQNDPGVWFVRGLWARQLHQDRVAARCLWETIRQRPHHRRALFHLGQVMAPLEPTIGMAFSERASKLKQYSDQLEQTLIQQGRDDLMMKSLIALLIEMGREQEAHAWLTLAVDKFGPTAWPGPMMDSLSHLDRDDSPRFMPDRDLSQRHDLSSYPDFSTLKIGSPSSGVASPPPAAVSQIRFQDQAVELGLEFTYFQSPDSRSRGVRIFESTGGGIGVLDYDLDGRSEFFLTQGELWNRGEEQPTPSIEYRDRLYRQSKMGFQDLTELAGLGVEDGYGQGCSVGDFNNDGYPDLYIANIGTNQLLMNNGDGTFSDVTRESGLQGAAWTTSCLILDLNADGNPDLYDVNYLQGDHIFSVECGANRCSVRDYAGAQDQVQLSQGDGTFVVVPDATPTVTPKGLGIVAFFVDKETRPSLFISNDQVPNFFLRPTEVDGKYTDQALLSGLAMNKDGNPTASMGVASGDLNHDQMTDLFVTNFEGEANTLYIQRSHGFFEDAIHGTGLREPGIPYVGWGTQFVDADNNGELDLVVANGHVADFGVSGVQYQMPTQFFRNTGSGHFTLLPPSEVGPLFERQVLGRSVATVDWNCDQRLDFIQSSIAAPVMLATNQTEDGGHSLGVRLHARTTARDAFGTRVEIRQGDAISSQRLLAGSGYQVSNQRQLHFGLGSESATVSVSIQWPSGTISKFEDIPVDTTLEATEGMSQVTLWNGTGPRPR